MLSLSTTAFESLGSKALYELLKLRSEVFVVEQDCAYLDPDDKDYKALHVMGRYEGKLVAYARLLPQGLSYAEASIGRVATHGSVRQMGFGRELMVYCIGQTLQQFGAKEIVISAQAYLEAFYTSLGFVTESDSYMEDDIPHIQMRYTST